MLVHSLASRPWASQQTCRLCKEPWDDDHFGKRCEEIEKRDEARARKKIEESMTEAVMRNCNACKVPISKIDGCNKVVSHGV